MNQPGAVDQPALLAVNNPGAIDQPPRPLLDFKAGLLEIEFVQDGKWSTERAKSTDLALRDTSVGLLYIEV